MCVPAGAALGGPKPVSGGEGVSHDDEAADRESARRRAMVRSVIAWVGPMLALSLAFLLYMLV